MDKLVNKVFKIGEQGYNQIQALRSSDFKNFCESASHYKNLMENKPGLMGRSRQLAKGSLIHCMLLEPEKVATDFVKSKLKTTRAKEFVQQNFAVDKVNKTLLSSAEWEECTEISNVSLGKQLVINTLSSGYAEVSAVAKVEGVWCKIRMDILDTDDGIITDIKTTGKPLKQFKYAVNDFGYDISVAFYLIVAEEAFKAEDCKWDAPTEFRFLPICKEPPYQAKLMALAPERMERCKEFVREKLREFAECMKTDTWADPEDFDVHLID